MSLDFISYLNHEWSPFGLNAVAFRLLASFIVAGSAFHWIKDMRDNWSYVWSRRARRVTVAMLFVIIVNALLLLSAAERDDPIRIGTWLLALSFLNLNIAMLLRFANDNTTERQYVRHLRLHNRK